MIYIKSAKQISAQPPLSESWLTAPQPLTGDYVRSQDPPFRQWLNPLESRRMGPLLKRAIVTATEAMSAAAQAASAPAVSAGSASPAVSVYGGCAAIPAPPAAIITGTGLGCIENTELLLNQLCRDGEQTLKPTNFMQSTHNTIGSLIAIRSHCHGYNSTYSHKAVSFDNALLDAVMQLRLGDIPSALVTANDEMTPSYFTILRRAGYLGQPGQVPATEASVAMMLDTLPDGALCELTDILLTTSLPELDKQKSLPVDAILVGTNGNATHDRIYDLMLQTLFGLAQSQPPRSLTDSPLSSPLLNEGLVSGIPLLRYKYLFGEGYSSSALGLYAAAHIVARDEAPAHMRCDGIGEPLPVRSLLVLNHSDGTCFSAITLRHISPNSCN